MIFTLLPPHLILNPIQPPHMIDYIVISTVMLSPQWTTNTPYPTESINITTIMILTLTYFPPCMSENITIYYLMHLLLTYLFQLYIYPYPKKILPPSAKKFTQVIP